jgi:hypothetical protein
MFEGNIFIKFLDHYSSAHVCQELQQINVTKFG